MGGAPVRTPSAYAPALSLHTVWTSGCSRSQAVSVPGSRPGSTSTGLWLSMSIRMVLYGWPRQTEKSSTPSTAMCPATGIGWARMSRISMSRQHGMASSATSLDPGRPASASATLTSASVSGGVRRANGVVSPGICSENVDRAPGADALEPADVRDHLHPPAAERKVGEPTLIAGVNPRRASAASWARRVARLRPDPERHQVSTHCDAVYRRGSELRQKYVNGL
jgi:hypothetical protein